MTFEHPWALLGLLALLPLGLLEFRASRRRGHALRLLLGREPLAGLLEQQAPWTGRIGAWSRMAAVALLIAGAAGPQWGREAVRRTSQGSAVVFVLDVSASMETRDVPPSRMEEARHEAIALLPALVGSRVGVVAFAGDAVRLCPLTLDPAAVRLTLETIGPGTVSDPGSDLGRALRAGLKLMPAGRRDEQAIVLWTDGEDLEGHARDAIAELRRSGLRVFVVGVGTPAGDVIPVRNDDGAVTDVKRDESGAVVRSRLDENLLRTLARDTRGTYVAASRPGGEVVRLAHALGSLSQSRKGTRLVERPVARFPLFALLACVAIVVFLAAPRRRDARSAATASSGTSASRSAAAWLVAFVLLGVGSSARAQSDWARGDDAYRRRDFVAAESSYARRVAQGRAPAAVLANQAAARAEHAAEDTTVERTLATLAERRDAAGQMSAYNLGTLLARRGETDRAIEALRASLVRNPDDADARWNLELMLRRREQERKDDSSAADKPSPEPPKPKPQSGQGQGAPPPSPAQPTAPRPQPQGGGAPGMTREQAERLLGSLGDLERLERQNRRRAQVQRERKGKDW